MLEASREGDVHVLTLNDDKNMLHLDFLAGVNAALDEVEAASEGPAALVLTGRGRFFSNGIDLAWLGAASRTDQQAFTRGMLALMGRVLVLPVPTVAAVNGHAFAAGAMLALACDWRVQREDRGWICLSEVDAGIPFAPPLVRLLAAKLPPATLRDAVLTGVRYDGPAAVAAGFCDAVAPEAGLLPAAVARAEALASKGRGIFAALKRGLYADVAAELGHPPA